RGPGSSSSGIAVEEVDAQVAEEADHVQHERDPLVLPHAHPGEEAGPRPRVAHPAGPARGGDLWIALAVEEENGRGRPRPAVARLQLAGEKRVRGQDPPQAELPRRHRGDRERRAERRRRDVAQHLPPARRDRHATRPSTSVTVRPREEAASRSWVTTTTVLPARASSPKSRKIAALAVESRLPV